ncbi:MAG: DUF1844 domain-containing protein [Phycisphaerales bacterium]|nr:DUF1844 domain-containing protein [Phycisphaerales bacterium]
MPDEDRPKIIIDDDWKAQAQAEKAKLAEKDKAKPAPAASAGPAGSPAPAGEEEPIGFADLVQMLASQALLYMGAVPDPQSGRAIVSIPMARAHVDLLGILEQKTKGNLSDEEAGLLTGVLYELRMQFVDLGRAIDKAIKEGKITPAQVAGMGGQPSSQSPPLAP